MQQKLVPWSLYPLQGQEMNLRDLSWLACNKNGSWKVNVSVLYATVRKLAGFELVSLPSTLVRLVIPTKNQLANPAACTKGQPSRMSRHALNSVEISRKVREFYHSQPYHASRPKRARVLYLIFKIDFTFKECLFFSRRNMNVWGFWVHDGSLGVDEFFLRQRCSELAVRLKCLNILAWWAAGRYKNN